MMDVRQLLGPQFEELAGAHIGGEIPLTDHVLNRLAAEALRANPDAPVESVEIRVTGGEITARLALRRPRFAPPITVAARVEQQPELPFSPVLALRWRFPGLGALAALAGPLVAAFSNTPAGIRVDGDIVLIDLAAALEHRGMRHLLDHVRSLRVEPREGAVLVRFETRVT
jgi:hypothetical protein